MSENVNPNRPSRRMPENVNPNNPYASLFGLPVDPNSTIPRHPRTSVDKQRIQLFTGELERIYHLIKNCPSAFLGPLVNNTLSIKCKDLKLKDNGFYDGKPKPCFFDPESIDVHRYPTNFDAEDDCHNHQQGVYSMIGSYTEDPSGGRQSAYMLCYEMIWAFDTYSRKGTRRDEYDLRSLTEWFPMDFEEDAIFADEFEDTLFLSNKPSWSPIAAYVKKHEDQPHIMFTMRHDIEPRGEDLLRGEALAIAAAMITRLKRFSSKGHIYVPVLVLSFLGNLKGRILQAYFDGQHIIIWKTKIYNFTPADDAQKCIDVFMQQMSSVPVGDTRSIAQHTTKGSPQALDLPFRQGLGGLRSLSNHAFYYFLPYVTEIKILFTQGDPVTFSHNQKTKQLPSAKSSQAILSFYDGTSSLYQVNRDSQIGDDGHLQLYGPNEAGALVVIQPETARFCEWHRVE